MRKTQQNAVKATQRWNAWMGVLAAIFFCGQAARAVVQLPSVVNPSTPAAAQTSLESFSPLRGLAGSTVTIRGRNLNFVTGVYFNGQNAQINGKSATTVTATVPPGATSGRITLVTPNNGSPISQADFVVIAPEVTAFSPESGPPGTMVRVSGVGLDNARSMRFGNRLTTVVSADATTVTARVPPGANTGLIGIVVGNQEAKTRSTFNVTAVQVAPVLSTVSPTAGAAGTSVQLSGANLGAVTQLRFNNTVAAFDTPSSHQITTVVPVGATTGRITIVWSGGTIVGPNFTVTGAPTSGNTGGPVVRNIVGRVTTRAGVGVPGVRIIWTGPTVNGAQTGNILFTDNAGNYVIRELKPGTALIPGTYQIAAQTRGFTFTPTIQSVTVGNGSAAVPTIIGTSNPATFTVSGRVLNRAGQPLGGVLVIAFGDRDPRHLTLADPLAYALTDDTGTYRFTGAPIDFYLLQPIKGGYNFTSSNPFSVNPRAQLIYVTRDLTPAPFQSTNEPAHPANDNFVSARAIAGPLGRITLSNVGATREVGEPSHGAGVPAAASLWYRWTAPASGKVTFHTAGSTYAPEYRNRNPMDTTLAVYTGNSSNGTTTALSGLTQLASNDNVSTGTNPVFTSSVTLDVVANRTYYIAIDGAYGVTGNINLSWVLQTVTPTPTPRVTSAPPNDLFARAQVLAGTTGRVNGTNVNATFESGEKRHAGVSLGRSVWYAWRAPFSGQVSFEIQSGTNFDTVMAGYTGDSAATVTQLAANDDQSSSNPFSKITFAITAGSLYRIAVDGYNNSNTGQGNFILAWTANATRGPVNDNLSNATIISGANGRINGANVGATKEDFEDGLGGLVGGHSIWYAWTAPSSGAVTFTTAASRFDTTLSVFRYIPQPGSFTLLTSNDDDAVLNATTSRVTFNAVAGGIYFFAVDGYNGAQGAVTLSWGNGSTTPPLVLTLSIAPATFSEGNGGAAARGTITRTAPATSAVAVPLRNTNPSNVVVPSSVTIPAGALSATFNVGAVDDTVVDGTQSAAISTAVSGATNATVTVSVLDNDTTPTPTPDPGTPPTNDDFARPFLMGGVSGRVTGSNVNATPEAFESVFDDFYSHSVWFIWVAPTSQTYTFNTLGSNFDTTLLAFRVDPNTRQTFFITSNDDDANANDGTSSVSFSTSAGTTYYLAIDGFDASQGNYALNWSASGTASATVANDTVKAFSTATATGKNIALTFAVPLDSQSASDAANFRVEVNGESVAIEAASYNNATHRVTLQVLEALPAGAKVIVHWPGLHDTQKRGIAPASTTLTAR